MSAYSNKVLADGAVAYWRLDETSGTTANSLVGSYPGTISGGVTLNQPGALLTDSNPAMAFNGTTGKISTGAFSVNASYTVELWLRTSSTAGGESLFSNRRGGTVIVYLNGGKLTQWIASPVSGGTSVNDNRWHHLAVTNNGTTTILYVDGVADGTGAQSHATENVTGLDIAFDQVTNAFCPGSLDEVAIYPTALTPTQIQAHYTAGQAAQIAGVPGWLLSEDFMAYSYNLWTAITPSDTADLPRVTDGLLVGGAGDVNAVMQNGQAVALKGLPGGAWVPIVCRRINATGTTATNLVALNQN